MTLDERLKLANSYNKEFMMNNPYYASSPQQNIEICEVLKALGYEWGYKEIRINQYYCYLVNDDIRVYKGGEIANKATKYSFDNDKYYIHWDNGNIGKYMFVSSRDYYCDIDEEWEEFNKILHSYNPLEWDEFNNHIIYSIEDGKRLANDYNRICKETRKKIRKKLVEIDMIRAKEKYEKLLNEVNL